MQEKSEKKSEFSERTEFLAKKLRINLSDLPPKIGVSNSQYHAYRSGKQPISEKAWRKLEAAERAAGIGVKRIEEAPEIMGNAECAGKLNDSPPPYGKNLSIEERLEALEAENAMLKSGLAEVFEALRPIFSESRPKKYSSEEPS